MYMAALLKKNLTDTGIRIITPLTLIISSALSQGAVLPPLTLGKAGVLARITVFIFITFEAGRQASRRIQKSFPQAHQVGRRVLLSFAATLSISFLLITLSTLVSRYDAPKPVSFASETLINFIQCLWIAVLITAPYEAYFSYLTLLNNEREKERLLRAHMQSQLNALRSQLNPHFLFNNLNTLSALIHKDPQQAEEFVIEMSDLYRKFLKTSKDGLATLAEELGLVRSYVHLLQARFGEGLQVHQEVAEEYLDHRLPSTALQVLIENAVKHNEVSSDRPLEVRLTTSAGSVVVTNNLQRKKEALPSSGLGLTSILAHYQHLQVPGVVIEEKGGVFRVQLPLIHPQSHERIDH